MSLVEEFFGKSVVVGKPVPPNKKVFHVISLAGVFVIVLLCPTVLYLIAR